MWPAGAEHVEGVGLGGVVDLIVAHGFGAAGPGGGGVDSFAVNLEPASHLKEALLHDDWYEAVGARTDVKEQIAATADFFNQGFDALG